MRHHAWALALAAGLFCAGARAAPGLPDGTALPVRQVAEWAVRSGDPGGLPFVIVDKVRASVYAFDARGMLVGHAPTLLGLAVGDTSVPGIGDRPLAAIRPQERTTPAGRFVAALGSSLQGDQILWVDYDGGVALHRVVTTARAERRLERLASTRPAQRRITYGCINVPVHFFDAVILPLFQATAGIVYVLPDTGSAERLFGPLRPADRPP